MRLTFFVTFTHFD